MKKDWLVAAAIFAAVVGVTVAAAPRQGINRDEAYYMVAGEQYVAYYEHALAGIAKDPFSNRTIARYWDYNHEHPPLLKVLYGLSWRLFHECRCARDAALHPGPARLTGGRHVTLPLFGLESTAFRLPTILFSGLLAAIVYLFVARAFGRGPGAIAAALLAFLQPRGFFHAQTAGFDLPAATLWLATTYAWWRALGSARRFPGVAVGLLWGLFLATKLQSFFLPLALGLHWLWLLVAWRRGRRPRAPSVWPIVWMAALGPLVLFASWPWLWHDTIRRFGAYLHFHLTHVHYNFEYLGTNYYHPPYPWHEPLGMLVLTAPVTLLALAAAGAVVLWRTRAARADERATGVLLAIAGLVPISLFLRGTVPIFGETKHWLATMAFLSISAGVAVQAIAHGLVAELRATGRAARAAVLALIVVAAAAPAAVETARSHPYGLSHYNALAGGAAGGADLGMNRQFWGYSVLGILDWLNRHVPAQGKVYLHDWNHDAYLIYRRERRLREDILDAGMEMGGIRASQTALVIHERHFGKYEVMIWEAYGTARPAHVLTLDGVPLVTVYQRP
jgi:4-amino-4-deoxy-L-arabinose transferase-like glycosyltransferase